MFTIRTLTISAIKIFVRNRQALFFTLFTPLIIMVVFGFIGFDRVPKINVGIITENPNPPTQTFLDTVKNIPAFSVQAGSVDQEAKALADGERAVVFKIPGDLIPQNPSGAAIPPRVIIAATNAGQQQQAQTAISVISQILDKTSLSLARAPVYFQMDTREINAQNLKYIDFLLPGIVALAIMQMAVFSVAFVFADYKEKGVLKRLLATPMKPY